MGKLEALKKAISDELIGKTIGKIIIRKILSPIKIKSNLPEDKNIYSMEEWTRVTIYEVQVRGSKIMENGDDIESPHTISSQTFDVVYDTENETFTAKLATI